MGLRGLEGKVVVGDLADPESVAALFNVGADMGALRGDSDVVDIDLDLWDRVMAVNLRGYVAALKSAIPLMLERGGGAIVNMSSAAAFHGALTRHVASLVAFLMSQEGEWVNGQLVNIDGGTIMR